MEVQYNSLKTRALALGMNRYPCLPAGIYECPKLPSPVPETYTQTDPEGGPEIFPQNMLQRLGYLGECSCLSLL